MKIGKKNKEEIQEKQETPDEEMIAYLGIQGYQVPEGYTQIESYPLNPPFSYAWIFQDDSEGSYFYVVDDLPMSRKEREAYKRLKNILEYELKAPRIEETLVDSFRRQLPVILEDHKEAFVDTNQVGLRKIVYYLEKDLIGYGRIDGLISDPFIEDISCLGINKPVYIYHRKYASTTNKHRFCRRRRTRRLHNPCGSQARQTRQHRPPNRRLDSSRKTQACSIVRKRNHPCRNKLYHQKIPR